MTFFTQLYPNFLFPVAGIPPWDVLTDAFQQQVLVETNWVRDVPTIEPEPLLRLIKPVRPEHLGKAGIRRSKLLISFCLLVLKIVGTVEVVFGACAIDGRELTVPIKIELDFALASPSAVVNAPGKIGAYVVSLAFDAVDDVNLLVRKRVDSTKLSVRVGGVFRDFGCRVIYLVVRPHGFRVQVFHGDLRLFPERHGPIGVERA